MMLRKSDNGVWKRECRSALGGYRGTLPGQGAKGAEEISRVLAVPRRERGFPVPQGAIKRSGGRGEKKTVASYNAMIGLLSVVWLVAVGLWRSAAGWLQVSLQLRDCNMQPPEDGY